MQPSDSLVQPITSEPQASIQKPKARDLFKQSYRVLKSDKELVLFPVYSAILSIAAFILIGAVYLGVRWGLMDGTEYSIVDYVFLFILYLVSYYIAIYFNAGLAACVLYRFKGGDPTFSYGRQEASKHKKAILGYALLGATVGVILNFIAERFKLVGRIIANILGAVWSIATIFIAPVLITTELTPLDAVKESARIFRSTWGNTVKGSIGFFFISMVGILICLIPFVVGATIGGAVAIFAGVILTIIGFIVLTIIVSTCSAIYRTALFHYATTKQIPPGFTPGLAAAVR